MDPENEEDFPLLWETQTFCWIDYEKEKIRKAILFVHHENIIEGWAFSNYHIDSNSEYSFKYYS